MSMIEWIAVCGAACSVAPVKTIPETEAMSRIAAQRAVAYENAVRIIQSGKAGQELNRVAATLVQQSLRTRYARYPDDEDAWLGFSKYIYYAPGYTIPAYTTPTYSVLVEDVSGNLHYAPATVVTGCSLAKYVATLCALPGVAKVDVRVLEDYRNQYAPRTEAPLYTAPSSTYVDEAGKWGGIIVGTRYKSLKEMAEILSGAVVPQQPELIPVTLQPSSTELMHPAAQTNLPALSQQTVAGLNISPWVLVGGAAAVVGVIALLRRNK